MNIHFFPNGIMQPDQSFSHEETIVEPGFEGGAEIIIYLFFCD